MIVEGFLQNSCKGRWRWGGFLSGVAAIPAGRTVLGSLDNGIRRGHYTGGCNAGDAARRGAVGVGINTTTVASRSDIADLFRRAENVGDFAELKVPMQMRFVEQAAEDGGISLHGVKVRIVRDPDLLGKNLYGYTHPNGSIDLYPNAFTSTEQLVKTLGHERTHTMQIDLFGHPNSYGDGMMQQLIFNENAAHGIEDSFWQYYLINKSGRLERFR